MKILVVDDHALVREGLRQVLKGLDPEVLVLEASRCATAFELATLHLDLDLVLLDLSLPDMNGLDALDQFGLRYADIPVIILSATEDSTLMRRCFDRGAAGFLPKSSLSEIMLSALRLVLSGGTYLPPEMLAPPSTLQLIPNAGGQLNITARQKEVLQLLVNGWSNKEIARQLELSEQTVKAHVTSILRALDVPTRSRAVVAAAHYGYAPR